MSARKLVLLPGMKGVTLSEVAQTRQGPPVSSPLYPVTSHPPQSGLLIAACGLGERCLDY